MDIAMDGFQQDAERLLVLIPAYNEQAAIGHIVRTVRATVPRADVVVIDDGSTDETSAQARAAGAQVVQHPFNLGIGGAVQTGLKFAQRGGYDVVLRLDGDGQHDPADIMPLLDALQERDVDAVFGSRFLTDDCTMEIPLSRRLGIRFFAWLVSRLTRTGATDTTSGFCALNSRSVDMLVAYMPQDYPEVESRIILHKAGLTTLELPANIVMRRTGVSSIDSWRSIYYAFKVSVAVMIAAVKDTPPPRNGSECVKEGRRANTDRTANHSRHFQPSLARGDGAVDP